MGGTHNTLLSSVSTEWGAYVGWEGVRQHPTRSIFIFGGRLDIPRTGSRTGHVTREGAAAVAKNKHYHLPINSHF